MNNRKISMGGWTMVEMIVALAILAALFAPLVAFLRTTVSRTADSQSQMVSLQTIRRAFVMLDHDFGDMTLITIANPTLIEFRLDSKRLPTYDPNRPTTVPGISWKESPDGDGDQFQFPTPLIPAWRLGDNLIDDDDDDIIGIDVQCRYALEGDRLVRDFNYNEAGWGVNRSVIAQGVASLAFDYFSFKSSPGNDALTTDGEGLINGATIDNSTFGNKNAVAWDTQGERNRIDMVRITIGCNPRSPSETKRTDISPDFLIVRRGRI